MSTDKKIKILFIHHGTGIGGAPISLLNLIKQLNQTKFKFKVAFVKDGAAVNLYSRNNIEVDAIRGNNKYFGHHKKGKIKLKYFFRYFSIYRNWHKTVNLTAKEFLSLNTDYDIIHLNSDVLTSWAYAAKKAGFKVVCHNRDPISYGYFGFRYNILKKLIDENVDAIINISNDNRNRLGLIEKSFVVYNFVDIPVNYRLPMSDSGPKKVLYLGGQAKIKGFSTAVKCLRYLDNNIRVQFGGNYGRLDAPKSFKEKIKNWIKLNIYRRTYRPLKEIKNAVNAELLGLMMDPYPTIDACDILITPFSVEHFSRPAMEAMAYGKPVIGSNVEGMDEIIDHGITGLLVEKNNPKALADAINYLCKNPEIAREMGRRGREKAEKMFSPKENTAKVEAIYERLMKDSVG